VTPHCRLSDALNIGARLQVRSKPLPKAIGHFWWLPASVSMALSALGIVSLALHAITTWSLSAPLALVMAAYNGTMQLLFGWAHPYLQAALIWLGSFIGWRPMLYPHWRDVFVVISVIGVGAGRAAWAQRDVDNERLSFAIAPIFGAAITGLAAGVLPLQSPDLMNQLLISGSIGLAVLPLLVFESVGEDFDYLAVAVVTGSGMSAFAAIVTCLLAQILGFAEGLGLAGLASAVVAIGLFLTINNVGSDVAPGSWARFQFQWGVTILGGFVGAAFVAAVDAGLKLLGA
jgi:hypothetical protein